MMNLREYLPITWPVLCVGLMNDWLTTEEVVTLVNDNYERLNVDGETLVKMNVEADNRLAVLEILRVQAEDEVDAGIKAWQLAQLSAIEQSSNSIHEKLVEIEIQWSRFGYPESWRDFIYYMPGRNTNTEDGVYRIFLDFLAAERGNHA